MVMHRSSLVDTLASLLTTPRRPRAGLLEHEARMIDRQPDAASVIRLVTRLYDPELPPAWVSHLWPASRRLIQEAVAARSGELDFTALETTLSLIDPLMISDGAAPRLTHLATPVAGFHALGSASVDRADLYRAAALLVHIQLRRLEVGMYVQGEAFWPRLDRNLWDYARSARLLIDYGPTTTETALVDENRGALVGSVPGPARRRLIDATVAEWCRGARRARATVEKRRTALEVLVGLRDHTILPGGRRPGPARGGWGTGDADDAAPDPELERSWSGRLIVSDCLPSMPEEAQTEGESPADYESEATGRREPAEGRGRRDRRGLELATMQALGFVHELGTAQPFELAEVYRRLLRRSAAAMTLHELEDALYILLLVEHGLAPEAIRSMPLVTEEPSEVAVALDVAAHRIWAPLPVIARPPAPQIVESFRPGSPWATTRLLHPAREFVARLCRTGARGTWAPGTRPFAVGNLPQRLQGRLEGTAAGDRRPGDLVARLARSGMRWLVRAGLPAVVAAGISGRFDITTRAPSAYANLGEEQVLRLHARAVSIFRAELAAEWAHQGASGPDLGDPSDLPDGADRRFGSMLVPRPEATTGFVRALEGRLGSWRPDARLDELARVFNCRVLYEYVRLLWTTAVRPVRDPLIRGARCQDGWLLVADKSNVFTSEARVVPLLADTVRRLRHLGEQAAHVRWRLRLAGQPIAPETTDACFFAVRDRRAVPWTPGEARRVLVDEGFTAISRWPLNVARHTWFTRALEDGVPLAVLEPFLGHVHEPGRAGPYSLISMAREAEVFREFAARMGHEAGFRDVN